jgi:hypothetical protein
VTNIRIQLTHDLLSILQCDQGDRFDLDDILDLAVSGWFPSIVHTKCGRGQQQRESVHWGAPKKRYLYYGVDILALSGQRRKEKSMPALAKCGENKQGQRTNKAASVFWISYIR